MNGNKQKVVLSFGGNQDDTIDCFKKAIEKIERKLGKIELTSSLYSTQAWGMKKSTNDFLNQIVILRTELKPKKLLKSTQKIEKELGRISKSVNGNYENRPIDIDILFFGNKIIKKKRLTVPHHLLHTRKFILVPLSEIMPDYSHPVLKKTIKELLLLCDDKLKVRNITKKIE